MLLKADTFTKKKFYRILLANLLSYSVLILSEMFDSFAAGAYIDSNAVAAIELITPIEYIGYAITMFVTNGIGVMYNVEIGRHNRERSYQIAGMGLLAALVMGITSCLLVRTFAEQIIGIYNCSIEVHNYAVTYLRVESFYFIPSFISYHIMYMVIADGDEKILTLQSLTVSITAIILPSFLASRYGLVGIASTSTIVFIMGAIVASIHYLSKRNSVKYKLYFSFKDFFELLKISSAYSFASIYLAIVDIIFNSVIINLYSDTHLLAYAVINFILNMAEILAASLGAGTAFITVSYGERNGNSIKRIMKLVLQTSLIASILMTVVLFIFAPNWPGLFGVEDLEIARLSIFAGRIVPLTFAFSAIVYSFTDYYSYVGKPLYGNFVSALYMLISPLVICLPIAYNASFEVLSIGFACTPVFTVLVMALFFVIAKKKEAPLFVPKSDEKELVYNLYLDVENIVELRDKLIEDLEKENINKALANEIGIVIEDGLQIIKNQNKKRVLAEITALYNKDHIRLIIKDDGKIFDLIKTAEEGKTLPAYTVDRMLASSYEKDNDLAISFNRNMFSWNI